MEKAAQSGRVIHFGVFELDLLTGELRRSGVRIKFQEQPLQVLLALLERPGEIVTRDELRERLWSNDTYVDFDRSLNTAVAKIREALSDSPTHPRFVETLPRRGYRFVAPVERPEERLRAVDAPEHEASAPQPTKPSADREPAVRIPSGRVWIAGLAAAAIAALLFLAWNLSRGREAPPVAPPEIAVASLAVLPLENLSGDPEQEYFSDGMTDMLITHLGTISALRVISRTSVMQYKGTRKPLLAEIGRELDVSHLVEGTVLREGDQVRIGVRLMEAASDRQVWGESYQRPVGQVLALQQEIARAVADAVQVKLNPGELARLGRNEAVSPEALDAYLRGWDALLNPAKGGPRKAVEYFQEAIDRSPNYALAHALLGAAYFMQAFGWDQQLTSAEAASKMRRAINKALEIDPTLAAAHVRLGELKRSFDYDWKGAEASYRRSLELNPNDWFCHIAYAFFLAQQGRSEEAIREATLARRLDPNSPFTRSLVAFVHLMVFRDFDKFISETLGLLETELATFPLLYVRLGEAYLNKGMQGEALAAFEKARAMSDDNLTLASLGHAYGVTGKTREAREILHQLSERSKQRPVSSDHLAMIYVGLGEKDSAADSLEKAYDERAPALEYLKVEPKWDPLRSHPRFQALFKKMNFPQ